MIFLSEAKLLDKIPIEMGDTEENHRYLSSQAGNEHVRLPALLVGSPLVPGGELLFGHEAIVQHLISVGGIVLNDLPVYHYFGTSFIGMPHPMTSSCLINLRCIRISQRCIWPV